MKFMIIVNLFLLFIMVFGVYPDTIIQANTTISGVWKKENSPYIVPSMRTIKKLVIEPGVEIKSDGLIIFDCDTLIACGTIDEPITLTANSSTSIRIEKSNYVTMSNFKFTTDVKSVYLAGGKFIQIEGVSFTGVSTVRIVSDLNVTLSHVDFKSTVCDLETSHSGVYLNGCNFQNVDCNFIQTKLEAIDTDFHHENFGKFAYIGDTLPLTLKKSLISGFGGTSNNTLKILKAKKLIVSECIIDKSKTGMEIHESDSVFFYNNIYKENGGAITFFESSYIDFYNNEIKYNKGGGGIRFETYNGNVIVRNNLIADNYNNCRLNDGGGISCNLSIDAIDTLKISGNIIVNNHVDDYGGGCFLNAKQIYCVNNTVANNFSAICAAVVVVNKCRFSNNILYGNVSINRNKELIFYTENAVGSSVSNCVLQNGMSCIGGDLTRPLVEFTGPCSTIINQNPLFVNPSEGSDTMFDGTKADWRLASPSPCIDAGELLEIKIDSTDYYGNKRFDGIAVDIGAIEFIEPVKSCKIVKSHKMLNYKISSWFDLSGRRLQGRPLNKVVIGKNSKTELKFFR